MPDLQPVPEGWDRCLAVAAHPDDLEYGSSCALARWTAQGKTVAQVLATSGEAGIDGLGGDFDPDSFLRGMTEGIGARVGVGAAVAFELIPT